jgi:hypothetical protein
MHTNTQRTVASDMRKLWSVPQITRIKASDAELAAAGAPDAGLDLS